MYSIFQHKTLVSDSEVLGPLVIFLSLTTMLEYEVIWGILVFLLLLLGGYLSRRLAGPSPTSPMKAKITISPISNVQMLGSVGYQRCIFSMASCQIPLWHVITCRDLHNQLYETRQCIAQWMLNEALKLSTINPGFSSTLFVLETGNSTDSPLLPYSIIPTFLDSSTNISTCVSRVLVYQDFAHLSPNAISPGLAQNMLDLLLFNIP